MRWTGSVASAQAPHTLTSVPMVTGAGQQITAQTCSVAWSTWASLQPEPNLLGFDGYRWLLDGAPIASGSSYTPTLANIGHELACSITVTYPLPLLVTALATSAPVIVTAPPKPVITAVSESARAWREGRALGRLTRAHRSHGPPTGTTFSFGLNVHASVVFTFAQARRGRRVGHTCVAPTRRNRRRRACVRSVVVGKFSFAAHEGANKVVFEGRISSASRLPPARYTLVIVATNTTGVTSTPVALHFAIVR